MGATRIAGRKYGRDVKSRTLKGRRDSLLPPMFPPNEGREQQVLSDDSLGAPNREGFRSIMSYGAILTAISMANKIRPRKGKR